MPSIKRNVKNAPKTSGFEIYDGPTPQANTMLAGVIKQAKYVKASTGRMGYNLLVEIDDARADRVQYKGYPAWVRLWQGDSDYAQFQEAAFYRAVTGLDEVDEVTLVFEGTEPSDMKGVAITKIGKKNPIGQRVKVQFNSETDNRDGSSRIVGTGIFPVGEGTVTATESADEDDDLLEEEEVDLEEDDEETEETAEEQEARLNALILPKLRAAAKELGIETAGKKKADLIDAIIDAEADSDDDEEEEEEELDVDENENEDEDEDEDEEADLRSELAELDRTALKARLKTSSPEFRVLKKHTDEDLLEEIVSAELDDEDGDEPPF